jgi:hypothetical protein
VLRSIVKAAIRRPFVTRAAGSRAVSRMTMAGRTAVFLYHEVSPAPRREALVHRVAPTGDLPTEDAFMSWLNFTLLRQPSRSAGAS